MRFYLIFFTIIFSIIASATLTDVDKQVIWGKNLLKNGGFENGKGTGVDKWTASAGAFSIATSGSNLLDGKVSFTWDAAASADTLSYGQITIPNGLKVKNGVFAMKIMVPSGTATHSLQVTDGTNVLGTVTITSNAAPTYSFINFVFPSSGYIVPRLYANANEVSITGDSAWAGDASEINLANISQSTFIGSAYIPNTANCTFTRTNTTLGAMSDSDCPGATVEFNPGPGTIQTTDYDAPKFTVNNLPPGNYRVVITAASLMGTSTTNATMSISDGTTQSGQTQVNTNSTLIVPFNLTGQFVYTTAGNRSFELFAASATNDNKVDLTLANSRLNFFIYRFPLSTETTLNPGTIPFLFVGRHDQTCQWSHSATTISSPAGDASCGFTTDYVANAGAVTSTFAGALTLTPGITITPPTAGLYEVCASFATVASGGAHTPTYKMVDSTSGTTSYGEATTSEVASGSVNIMLCGHFPISSIGTSISPFIRWACTANPACAVGGANTSITNTSIKWTVRNLSQSIAAPLLVNTVVTASSGVTGIYSARVSSADVVSNEVGGDWINGDCTDATTGKATCVFNSGIFSAAPNCWANNDGGVKLCQVLTAGTTSQVSVNCMTTAGANENNSFELLCMGPH